MVRFSEIQQISRFSGNLPRKFPYQFLRFEFLEFLAKFEAPLYLLGQLWF